MPPAALYPFRLNTHPRGSTEGKNKPPAAQLQSYNYAYETNKIRDYISFPPPARCSPSMKKRRSRLVDAIRQTVGSQT